MERLEQLLLTPKLVQQAPTSELIRGRAKQNRPSPLTIFYGETYDDKGNPIDSLKYYLVVSALAAALKKEGIAVEPTILVADSAACRNVGDEKQGEIMRLGEHRFQFVQRTNEVYGTDLRVRKMSDYVTSPEFVTRRGKIVELCNGDQELMRAVEKTVPESKTDTERTKGFLYSFDEITTIVNLDLKVGPPREDLYDNVARAVAKRRKEKEIMSLFLSPTFPLGMGWSYFFVNEGIEDHGITAYKAGSKRLQRQRIIVGASNPDYVRSLLDNSFISLNPSLPNPVLDIGLICEMARRKLTGDNSPISLAQEFYTGEISPNQLKKKVGQDVETYVLSKF